MVDGAVFKEQMATGRVYAKTKRRLDRLQFSRDTIVGALSVAKSPYVSLSFGKQSICLAHMVNKIDPSVPAYFLASEETWSMYDYAEVIDAFREMTGMEIHIKQTNRLSEAIDWKSARDLGDRDLQSMCSRDDFDLVFMGLAKEESKARRITLGKGLEQYGTLFQYKDKTYRSCPLKNWKIDDIAAYLGEFSLPVLNIYRKFGLQHRTTARLTKKAVSAGATPYLRWTNSQGNREILNQIPEIESQ